MASDSNNADTVRLLASLGADVNHTSPRGETPLRVAAGRIPPSRNPRADLQPPRPPRDPDPDGARQLATVRALLQLGAGTLPTPRRRRPPTHAAPRSF
jgi:hypothetical protein